jgi:hypothetical protein
MKTYEVINPSDPYTFQAPDRQIATLTIFVLSTKFAATCVSHPGDEEDVPLFLLGGWKEWWEDTFPEEDLQATFEKRSDEVVEALESMLYGRMEDRAQFGRLTGPIEDNDALRDMRIKWNDENRTSLNDISAAAYAAAASLRKQ